LKFLEVPNIKFHVNASSESRADIYRQTNIQTNGQTANGWTEGLKVWYHFSRWERFYGELMLPVTIKHT